VLGSPAVGAFFSPLVSFGIRKADETTNMTLSVTPSMEVRAGEQIVLTLPGFNGAVATINASAVSPPGFASSAEWDQAAKLLTLQLAVNISGNETYVVTISSNAGSNPTP